MRGLNMEMPTVAVREDLTDDEARRARAATYLADAVLDLETGPERFDTMQVSASILGRSARLDDWAENTPPRAAVEILETLDEMRREHYSRASILGDIAAALRYAAELVTHHEDTTTEKTTEASR